MFKIHFLTFQKCGKPIFTFNYVVNGSYAKQSKFRNSNFIKNTFLAFLIIQKPFSESAEKHKFGITFFKLCLEKRCTYNFKVYFGKFKDEQLSILSKTVLDFPGNLLDKGRTVYTVKTTTF